MYVKNQARYRQHQRDLLDKLKKETDHICQNRGSPADL